MDQTKSRIWAIAEPIAADLGLEVLEIELGGRGAGRLIRVYLDSPGSARAVTVDDCERVARQLGDSLEAHGAADGDYTLEVSSPGLDRPLRKREHFERVLGERIKVRTHTPVEGRRNFAGTLKEIGEDRLKIETDEGATHELELNDLDKANLQYRFAEPAAGPRRRSSR